MHDVMYACTHLRDEMIEIVKNTQISVFFFKIHKLRFLHFLYLIVFLIFYQ